MLRADMTIDDFNRGYPFDFNAVYQGYYEECKFTAFAYILGAFRLAGTDKEGAVHFFSSCEGSVWEEAPLIMNTPYGISSRPKAPVIKILGEERENQLYLVCEDGEIVILPDCPKCIHIRKYPISEGERVTSADFICGRISDNKEGQYGYIRLRLSSGAEIRIDPDELRQYRVAVSFAKMLISKGASVIDVRDEADYAWEESLGLPGMQNIPLDDLSGYLDKIRRDQILLFICRTGRKADQAAEYARKKGFYRAYSIGGTEKWAHLE